MCTPFSLVFSLMELTTRQFRTLGFSRVFRQICVHPQRVAQKKAGPLVTAPTRVEQETARLGNVLHGRGVMRIFWCRSSYRSTT